ncbi:probable mediator of RNA polymerase II transcription subunit 26c isoform X1 [Henckelia pumila]|uniref:probable mediator of RNA polymerase II transcription subunit 26c isoform X1 n=1 Tax=Henckelia pumila TaxID=405737 RepID=UPI003C6E5AA4
MDSEEFRAILSRSRVGIWSLIETAIRVANSDYAEELRRRRDRIVEALYTPPSQLCRSCNSRVHDDVVEEHQYYPDNNTDTNTSKKSNDYNSNRNSNEDCSKSPLTPESNNPNFSRGDEEDLDPYGGLFDDEQTKILSIKEQLEDPLQSEDAVVDLLQILADMDITFQALKETDIGRHVNRLRKHPSSEVRRLVKMVVRFLICSLSDIHFFIFLVVYFITLVFVLLVIGDVFLWGVRLVHRKWKETVDEWVKVNQPQAPANLLADGDSPQHNLLKNQQNGHHQVPDFGYSPNPLNGSSSVERNYAEYEPKPKPPQTVPRKEARPPHSIPKSSSAPPNRAQRESVIDDERLNSARRRLQENYQEAENAKKQRTIQMMDIHEIPKPKNAFFAKNKGGFQGRQHR